MYKRILSLSLSFIIGFLISWGVSNYFHSLSLAEQREALVDGAILEANLNNTNPVYKSYIDAEGFEIASAPYYFLQNESFNELYKNIYKFDIENENVKVRFVKKILDCRAKIDYYNRNLEKFLLTDSMLINQLSDRTFGYYFDYITSTLDSFVDFVEENRNEIINY